MIAREYRFHGYNALGFVYRKGKTVRSRDGSLAIRYAANTRQERLRLAVVVSKKVSKSAVVRNRIRRRLYEQAREMQVTSSLAAYDIVITAFDERLASMPAEEVRGLMTGLMSGLVSGMEKRHADIKHIKNI